MPEPDLGRQLQRHLDQCGVLNSIIDYLLDIRTHCQQQLRC